MLKKKILYVLGSSFVLSLSAANGMSANEAEHMSDIMADIVTRQEGMTGKCEKTKLFLRGFNADQHDTYDEYLASGCFTQGVEEYAHLGMNAYVAYIIQALFPDDEKQYSRAISWLAMKIDSGDNPRPPVFDPKKQFVFDDAVLPNSEIVNAFTKDAPKSFFEDLYNMMLHKIETPEAYKEGVGALRKVIDQYCHARFVDDCMSGRLNQHVQPSLNALSDAIMSQSFLNAWAADYLKDAGDDTTNIDGLVHLASAQKDRLESHKPLISALRGDTLTRSDFLVYVYNRFDLQRLERDLNANVKDKELKFGPNCVATITGQNIDFYIGALLKNGDVAKKVLCLDDASFDKGSNANKVRKVQKLLRGYTLAKEFSAQGQEQVTKLQVNGVDLEKTYVEINYPGVVFAVNGASINASPTREHVQSPSVSPTQGAAAQDDLDEEEQQRLEEKRIAEQQAVAELERQERERLEEKRIAEQQAVAELERQERERLEEKRIAEQQAAAERERQERERLEAQKAAEEQQRLEEQQRIAERERQERERLEAQKAAEEQQRLEEQQRIAEQQAAAERERLEAQKAAEEQQRLEEQQRIAEQQAAAERERLEAQKAAEEQQRLEEQQRIAEQQAAAERERLEAQKAAEEQQRLEEQQRIAEQQAAAERERLEAQKAAEEQQRLEEQQRIAEQQAAAERERQERERQEREQVEAQKAAAEQQRIAAQQAAAQQAAAHRHLKDHVPSQMGALNNLLTRLSPFSQADQDFPLRDFLNRWAEGPTRHNLIVNALNRPYDALDALSDLLTNALESGDVQSLRNAAFALVQ